MTTTTHTQSARSLIETAEDRSPDSAFRLMALHQAVGELHREIAATVAAMREDGQTWERIGACLNITRQAAQKYYGR